MKVITTLILISALILLATATIADPMPLFSQVDALYPIDNEGKPILNIDNGKEVKFYNEKRSNNTGNIIETNWETECILKPDYLDDGKKTCYVYINTESKTINISNTDFSISFDSGIKPKITWEKSTTYRMNNKTFYINNSKVMYSVREYYNWQPLGLSLAPSIGGQIGYKGTFVVDRNTQDSYNILINNFGTIDPVLSCGSITSTGTYTLNETIYSNGNCISIETSNVTLDGAGYSLINDGADGTGIDINNNLDNITIKNFADIINFTKGVSISGLPTNVYVYNITVHTNDSSFSYGLSSGGCNGCVLNKSNFYTVHSDNSPLQLSNPTNFKSFNNYYEVATFSAIFFIGYANGQFESHNDIFNDTGDHNSRALYIRNSDNIIENATCMNMADCVFFEGGANHQDNNTLININGINIGILIDDGENNASTKQYLSYSNSFGEVKWINDSAGGILRDMDVPLTGSKNFRLGNELVINNNTFSVDFASVSSPNKLNDTTNITFYNLGFNDVDRIFYLPNFETDKAVIEATGTNCIASSMCNILSDNGNTLVFNTTSLGSFTAKDDTECGYLNKNTVLTVNITTNGNCFTINASNIVLDGAGYSLTSNFSGDAINATAGVTNVTIKNFGLITNFSRAVYLSGVSNITIYNSTITNLDNQGVSILNSNGINVSNIIFNATSNEAGLVYTNNGDNSFFEYNTITTSGDSAGGIEFTSGSSGNKVYQNTILTSNTFANGISISQSNNNQMYNNNLTCTNLQSYPIQTSNSATGNNIYMNILTNTHASGDAILLTTGGSILWNNNFTGGSGVGLAIDDYSGNGTFNTLIYNNSYGQIKWIDNSTGGFLDNMNVDEDIWINRDVYFGDNVFAFNVTKYQTYKQINSSANITLTGLTYPTIERIMFTPTFNSNGASVRTTGNNCNGTTCQILSYSGGTLVFNTTELGSFSVDNLTGSTCGTITTSTTLNNDISASGTCFTVGANDIFLDFNGFTVTGDGTGNGIYNNGYSNFTIHNYSSSINNFENSWKLTSFNIGG